MMKCPNCNAEIPDTSIYCIQCKTKISKNDSTIQQELVNKNQLYKEGIAADDIKVIPLGEHHKEHTTEFKENFIQDLRRFYNGHRELVIKASIVLFTLIALIIFSNSSTGKSLNLKIYGMTKNSKRLVSFIESNKEKLSNEKLVGLAVQEITEHQLKTGINYLDKTFFDGGTPYYLKFNIISSFNKQKIKFVKSKSICDYYIDNMTIDQGMKKELITMMKKYPPNDIENDFYDRINLFYTNKDIYNAINVTNNYIALNVGTTDRINSIKPPVSDLSEFYILKSNSQVISSAIINLIKRQSQTEIDAGFITTLKLFTEEIDLGNSIKLIEFYKKNFGNNKLFDKIQLLITGEKNNLNTINESNSMIQEIDTQINDINNQVSSTQDQVNALNTQADDLRSQLSDAEDEYNKLCDFSTLKFYVTGQLSDNKYEIALPDYSYYYGDIPSDKHAILYTTDTNITSKGWGTMDVYYSGDEQVTLKENYGGFKQQWPIYTQVSSSERSRMSELEESINNAQSALDQGLAKVKKETNILYNLTHKNLKFLNNSKKKLNLKIQQLNNSNVNINNRIKSTLS